MKPLSRKNNIVVQTMQDETLVYDLTANKALLLNKTSTHIWNLCDGTKNVAQLSALLTKEFKQTADENIVRLALEQLKENNLLENPEEISISLAGNSRRAAIKKIGLTTMIALPVISALLAPTSAQAASSCAGDFQPCIIDDNKQSNCCNANQRCTGGCSSCQPAGVNIGIAFNQAQCDSNSLRNLCCSGTTTFNGVSSCRCDA